MEDFWLSLCGFPQICATTVGQGLSWETRWELLLPTLIKQWCKLWKVYRKGVQSYSLCVCVHVRVRVLCTICKPILTFASTPYEVCNKSWYGLVGLVCVHLVYLHILKMYDSNLFIFLFGGNLPPSSHYSTPQTLLKRNIQKQNLSVSYTLNNTKMILNMKEICLIALPTTKQDIYIYISPNPGIQLRPWNTVLSGVEMVGAVLSCLFCLFV